MITPDDVRRFFEHRHPWMDRLLRPVSRAKFALDPDRQAEFRHNAITLAFANVLRSAELGKIGDDAALTAFTRQSLWYAIRSRTSGGVFTTVSIPR